MELSDGQQQLLSVARVIANRPEVLLFDEPCSYIDAVSAARIKQLVYELKEDHTVVMATNNLHQAARVSDFCGVILEPLSGEDVQKMVEAFVVNAERAGRSGQALRRALGLGCCQCEVKRIPAGHSVADALIDPQHIDFAHPCAARQLTCDGDVTDLARIE